jgi:hypothetical protein
MEGEWLRELVLGIGGLVEAPSRYKDDLAYWLDGREIAHLEADHVLDLRRTRAVIRQFKDDPRVVRRAGSDWAMIEVSQKDGEFVKMLVGKAIEANRS